jgi:hypothetical protein
LTHIQCISDSLFHTSYDASQTVRNLLKDASRDVIVPGSASNAGLCKVQEASSGYALGLSRMNGLLGLDSVMDSTVSSLLETQRRCFDVALSFHRLASSTSTSTSPAPTPFAVPILVLDEYLDKDVPSVRRKFIMALNALSADNGLQVFVVTHSRGVWLDISEYTLVMNHGRLYYHGLPTKAQLPAQLIMIP